VPAVSERLDVFDGLRGFAILLVLWYHVWLVTGQSLGPLNIVAEAGFLGVDLFFFISGFCLFYPYARAAFEGRKPPTAAHFFRRRALKIVPSYLLVLATFMLVNREHFASLADAGAQLASHLTFLHTLNPATFGGISGPLWTIGIEVQFYFLFPLIAPLFGRFPLLGYGVMLLLGQIYRSTVGANDLGSSFWATSQLPAFLDIFGAGMLAAWLLVTLRGRMTEQSRTIATMAAAFGFALLLAGLAVTTVTARDIGGDAIHGWVNAHRIAFGPICLLTGVSSALAVERWRAAIAFPPLVFLSAISYNLYLWHLEIAVWLHNPNRAPGWSMAMSAIASVIVAGLITYCLERPILESRHPWLRPAQQKHRRLERHHGLVALVGDAEVHHHDPAVGLGARRASFEHIGRGAERVAGPNRGDPADLVHSR
jgi:peptidoglycan/LPS O-acetylase OafA/YrhL